MTRVIRLAVIARPEWLILLLGLIHRSVLLLSLRGDITKAVADAPDFQAVQLLPHEIYTRHFWSGMWLLQQTPPVPHVIFRIVLLAEGWPVRTALLLCALQGVISIATAFLLCIFIRRLTGSTLLGAVAALWFLFSTDLVVSEYALFGQMFHENLAMLLVLGCAMQACGVSAAAPRAAGSRAVLLGVIVACAVLTRSSLNFLPLAVAAAGLVMWPRRIVLLYCAPVVVLVGLWSIKNWISLGEISVQTSSWTGMNLAKGVYWAKQDLLLTHDIAASRAGDYPVWFKEVGTHYMFPFEVSTHEVLPPALRARDDEMTRRLGGVRATWNLPSVAAESQAWREAVMSFSIDHPALLWQRFSEGYAFVWQRIADHAVLFPWNIVYVLPELRPFPGLLSRGFAEEQRATAGISGSRRTQSRPAQLGTVSLAPLDALSILTLHAVFPVMALVDAWRGLRGKRRYLPQSTTVLAAIVVYGLAVFSIGEGGENMRFRLAIEPVLLALVATCVVATTRLLTNKSFLLLFFKKEDLP